jgi:DNA-binding NarL/FixJ family response regulator
MVDGMDELSNPERDPYFAGLVENIELHMADVEVVGDEIRKVQELISETIHDGGQKWKTGNLGEATERLEKRVRKWILQLSDQFRVVKSEILKLQNGQMEMPAIVFTGATENRNVVLLDNRVLIRRGLRRILESRPGFKVIGEANGFDQLECSVEGPPIDLLIARVSVQMVNEMARIALFKRRLPSVKVLALVERGNSGFSSSLLRCGADGYLLDESTDQRLFYAMEKILKGEPYLSPAIAENLVEVWGKKESGLERRVLTDRENEVLKLVAGGKSSRSIAEELLISVHTVDRHRANMMAKLNLRKATDLVKYAISQGILVPDGGSPKDE